MRTRLPGNAPGVLSRFALGGAESRRRRKRPEGGERTRRHTKRSGRGIVVLESTPALRKDTRKGRNRGRNFVSRGETEIQFADGDACGNARTAALHGRGVPPDGRRGNIAVRRLRGAALGHRLSDEPQE